MDECCAPPSLNLDGFKKQDDAYRRVLWAMLAINAAMFAVEVIAGLAAGSALALQGAAIVICQSLAELRAKRGTVIRGLTS